MNFVCFLLMSVITLVTLGMLCQLCDSFNPILCDEFSPPLKKKISKHYLFQAQTVICDYSGNI